MQPESQTDHVALLALMMVGVLTKRLMETGQLDSETAHHLHRLVSSVRSHAKNSGLNDLDVLFGNVDKALATAK